MKLTKTADYGLRVVLYLGTIFETDTMPHISEKLNIPYNNLMKIVSKLSKAHIIETKQGKSGGIRLLRDPKNLSILEIVELIDGPVKLSDCLDKSDNCHLSCHCELKAVFLNLQNQINTYLDNTKVSDVRVTKEKKELCHER